LSRETDTPSSGPSGRGGAAYPSGTPPYGVPAGSGDGAGAGSGAAQPEERKTETTLTTRVKINIPGSRPIPPVVVRKPVAGAGGDTDGAGGALRGERADADKASGGGRAAHERAGSADAGARGAADHTGATRTPGGQGGGRAGQGDAEPASRPAEKTTSDWFQPRKPPVKKSGQGGAGASGGAPGEPAAGPAATGGPAGGDTAAPGAGRRPGSGGRPGGVVGSMNVPGAARTGGKGSGLPGATGGPVAPGHGGGTGSFDVTEALAGSRPGGSGEPRQDDPPYASGTGPDGARDHTLGGSERPGGGPQGPAGPTGGPVTGDGAFASPGAPGAPAGAHAPRPGGGLSDDTAVLTPQRPAPAPGGAATAPRPQNVSGDTVTSGIPVIQPGGKPPAATPPQPSSAQSGTPAKKKGRSKLVPLGGGVVVVAAVAYGAGLLMNHSDVPKGTTVLGVDIGGGTRDDAVKKLDEAFGKRVDEPMKLSVDGKTVTLTPDQAGLQFDTQATASAAATSDYNPVSVIGSLFGNHRVVEPRIPVDQEKLRAALRNVAGDAGTASDGTIRFEPGKAVPVYGKTGKGIDPERSVQAIEEAYRTQVATGTPATVQVPTTTRRPTVPDAEVDRMMKEFAEPAMSDKVTVMTDPAHSVVFSPEKSLWKFLRVKAVNGKLVDSYDETVLKQLYGGTFDGVLITRGTGQKTPVTVQDVISAMRPALMSKTDRVAVIDTNPS
jgi:hypothetical protein